MTRDELRVLLFSALSEGADLHRLLDVAHRAVFDNPIMLTNSSFRTLDLCSDVQVTGDVVWTESETMGAFSRETIETFRHDLESSRLFVDRKAFIYATGLGAKIPRILAPVDSGADALGYLIIFGVKHPIREEEPALAEVLCEALRIILRRPSLQDAGMNLVDYTLKQLLDGKDEPREALNAAITKKTFLAGSISMPEDRKKKQYIPYLQESFIGTNSYNHCFVHQDAIFFLENFDMENEHRRTQKAVRKLLSQFGLCAGISNAFSDISKLRIYYGQAAEARKTGVQMYPGELVYEYRSLQVPVMLSRYSEEEKLAMITPEYRLLQEYDAEHHTELAATVVTWYRTAMNITQTAQSMHIHRNTVAYRLELAREKLKIPINRMDVLEYIVLSDIIFRGI